MEPADFKKAWTTETDKTIPISLNHLEGFNLLPSTKEFLNISGIPEEAAPFLSFIVEDSNDPDKGIVSVSKKWTDLEVEYDRYVDIGFDGSGSPIVIDPASNDQILWLDHDYDFEPCYLNESIEKLCECLLVYRNFIDEVITKYGEGAWLDGNYSEEDIANVRKKLEEVDPVSMQEDGFWYEQVECLYE